MIPVELFAFSYIPSWYEQLYDLAQMAEPEPWRFLCPDYETQNDATPILERYINQVFRKLAIDYNTASPEALDNIIYIRSRYACFNTGLYTPNFKAIFMCFERNKRLDTLRQWYFKGFYDEGSVWLKYVQPLPQRPAFSPRHWVTYFDPDWEIRINADHILGDDENVQRLPESIRAAWNLPLMLETAVEQSRRRAFTNWNHAVPQVFHNRVQYLLPIYLTRVDKPDLAMALSPMDGFYLGHTCLTPAMAYQNARLLARPSAGWLTALVEPERRNDA